MVMVKSRTATTSKKTTKARPIKHKPITETQLDSILDQLIISFARNPEQTQEDQRSITSIIAKKCNVTIQRVAAVRAHLTMGTYYSETELNKAILAKRRSLNQAAKARSARRK